MKPAILLLGAVFAACSGEESRSRIAVAQVERLRTAPGEQHLDVLLLGYDASGAWTGFDSRRDNQTFESGRIVYAGTRIARVHMMRIDGVTSTTSYGFDGERLTDVDFQHTNYSLTKTLDYDDQGRLVRVAGSGATHYAYDGEGRLERMESFNSASSSVADSAVFLKYADGEDRLTRLEFSEDNGTFEYKYDDDDVLVGIEGPTLGWTIAYDDEGRIARVGLNTSMFQQVTTYKYESFEVQGLTFSPSFDLGMLYDLEGRYFLPDPLAIELDGAPSLP